MRTTTETDPAASADADAASRHVLLVEDNPRIAAAFGLRLESCGYRVSCAASLAEAADKVIDLRPDVAILDINLPDGSGLQLAERMRLLRGTADVPLVFVTASLDPRYRERAADFGAPLVAKPFEAHELVAAIDEVCAGRDGASVVPHDPYSVTASAA